MKMSLIQLRRLTSEIKDDLGDLGNLLEKAYSNTEEINIFATQLNKTLSRISDITEREL
ncbi:hypothetical protein LCGC14_0405410 [marine sediment metagenome]|uniref:Uncharacterized protein n=1 Tax=marine sediment metagenome TaxID=412755 RepID=A0A0F9TDI8_9ZZZZ